ncbi:MAG TPA: catalase [Kofleriaceae bacterium]|nr:catalase [Kofleriaceae bacterium]
MKPTAHDPKRDRAVPTKQAQLESFREFPEGTTMVTDQGVAIPHTDDSLRGGQRGPTLLEDFHLREKITRFDHERIPERVVHARGSGAHGVFRVYESLADLTRADFLCDPTIETPVFVRFSTVQGPRGSADTVRDVRGFATKFYTREGNFDLVGNNMPVFFIQDGIKFPDIVHAVKPEPHHEMPTGASAHDTFWDFVSLVPETAHMVMWLMSDRAIPRSYRMMEGFGVHTFKLVDARGRVKLCKFHWKPLLGAHSLVWDEAQKIIGKDPDFHRRDLWEAIEAGHYPEWELGLQVVDEADELKFGFDLLDVTKLLPEEVVPVRRVGRMTLDRNPDNFFAETEQIAFCVNNLVPGIDATNDPMMQARMFSYLDTQLTRLGGPNFAEIPINRPRVAVHNHQQDGFHRDTITTSRVNYHPNSIGGGCPFLASMQRGFVHDEQPVAGAKVRAPRAETFADHTSQARMFLRSQSPAERQHLLEAFQFEISKVEHHAVRERVVRLFLDVDQAFALEIARGLGLDGVAQNAWLAEAKEPPQDLPGSPALSLDNQPRTSIKSRRIAILATDGADGDAILAVKTALAREGAMGEVVADRVGTLRAQDGSLIPIDKSVLNSASVLFDAVYVAGGAASAAALVVRDDAVEFVRDAYRHAKAVAATGEGQDLLEAARVPARAAGVVVGRTADAAFTGDLVEAIRVHRHFARQEKRSPGGRSAT